MASQNEIRQNLPERSEGIKQADGIRENLAKVKTDPYRLTKLGNHMDSNINKDGEIYAAIVDDMVRRRIEDGELRDEDVDVLVKFTDPRQKEDFLKAFDFKRDGLNRMVENHAPQWIISKLLKMDPRQARREIENDYMNLIR